MRYDHYAYDLVSCAKPTRLVHLPGALVSIRHRGTPALKALDHPWCHVEGRVLANRPIASIDAAADQACWVILNMSRHERLWKAGGLSGNFWLTK
jgi:hypothetical protein